jgi:hypothetical protein
VKALKVNMQHTINGNEAAMQKAHHDTYLQSLSIWFQMEDDATASFLASIPRKRNRFRSSTSQYISCLLFGLPNDLFPKPFWPEFLYFIFLILAAEPESPILFQLIILIFIC